MIIFFAHDIAPSNLFQFNLSVATLLDWNNQNYVNYIGFVLENLDEGLCNSTVEFTNNTDVYDSNNAIVRKTVPAVFGGKRAYPMLGLASNSMLMIHTESFGQLYVKVSNAHQIFNAEMIKLTGEKVSAYSVDNYLLKVGELTPNAFGGLEYMTEKNLEKLSRLL